MAGVNAPIWPGPGQVSVGLGPRAVQRLRRLADLRPDAAYVRGDRPRFWWEVPARASLEWELAAGAGWRPLSPRSLRIAALLGLGDRLDLRPEALAPVERTALDLTLALAVQPTVLLWEEPFFGLGGPDRCRLATAVMTICRQEGVGLAAVSRRDLAALRALSRAAETAAAAVPPSVHPRNRHLAYRSHSASSGPMVWSTQTLSST